ncbi:MAG: ABC transporter substrate-binding protein [Caldilineaceae bacterium]|nr:ABC transporter substrate-binding protein [Caldilineaceae bacterium]
MRRVLTTLLLVLVLGLMLAACGAPPSQPPAADDSASEAAPAAAEADAGEAAAEPEPTATPIVAEAGSGDIQLIYWNGLTGSDGATMVQMVEAFAAENPDVSVRIEMMPWGIYFDKLLASLVSGNPPDLFLLHEFEIPQFASQGVLMPSGDFFTSQGGPIPADDIAPDIFKAIEYQGETYGVPLDRHGWGLWYNKDLFEAAGLDPESCPATAEEFITYARKLTMDGNGNTAESADFDPENVVQWGTQVAWFKPTFLSTLWQFGGDWTDGNGNATINSDAGMQAAQFWYDLIYTEHVAPAPAGFDGWQSFAGGQLAMTPEGSWMLNFNNDNEVNWGVCPLPQWGSEQPAAWTSSHVIYTPISLEGDKLDAAKRLVAYLSDQGLVWATSGQPPARVSQVEAMTSEDLPSAKLLGESFLAVGRYDIAVECISEIIDQGYSPELDAIFNNVKSVEQGLNDANDRIQDILGRCQ